MKDLKNESLKINQNINIYITKPSGVSSGYELVDPFQFILCSTMIVLLVYKNFVEIEAIIKESMTEWIEDSKNKRGS